MDSDSKKSFSFTFLLLLAIFHGEILREGDARPLPFVEHDGYVKVLQTLGLRCRCCDAAGGDCRSSWDAACEKLDCRPWKFS
ncbi:hypothetical protein AXF42_Ash017488 [Apostasia shenzhenica]|uniref:Uncharacterized protein n=1 Tax=Apostasia shenzhenica TaxID=1088818 RepID=A0A2H9ZZ65_9ASPA|nr:hypothetical protein AXF42_Ash017488 [Apostasia shenzhenica]